MTTFGGSVDRGVIFSIDTSGTNFQVLHSFLGGGNSDGDRPMGSLILSGSTLYGMTYMGGRSDKGTIFSVGTDGTNFQLLHSFAGGKSDGANPGGNLILSDSLKLYGMTYGGGSANRGTIFFVDTDGSYFQVLHSFLGGSRDGMHPTAGLILSGSTLYGTTWEGGRSYAGTIFAFFPGVMPTQPSLRVVTSGTGKGYVTSSPAGIDCGSACANSYKKGTKMTLTPAPESGSVFTGWTGGCTGTTACSVIMSEDITVGATFDTGSCTYAIPLNDKTLTYKGGAITVKVTASGYSYCPKPDISIDIKDSEQITYAVTPLTNNKGSIKITIPIYEHSAGRTGTMTIGGNTFTVNQAGQPCTFSLIPASSYLFPAGGEMGTFNITTTPTDCPWTTRLDAESAAWITIFAGQTSGTGIGGVDYLVAPNATGKVRTGKIMVTVARRNKTYKVKQAK
jgi:uncharacterized repeat protein (TIGR03803 family)